MISGHAQKIAQVMVYAVIKCTINGHVALKCPRSPRITPPSNDLGDWGDDETDESYDFDGIRRKG